jgi:hypothetical protein
MPGSKYPKLPQKYYSSVRPSSSMAEENQVLDFYIYSSINILGQELQPLPPETGR